MMLAILHVEQVGAVVAKAERGQSMMLSRTYIRYIVCILVYPS